MCYILEIIIKAVTDNNISHDSVWFLLFSFLVALFLQWKNFPKQFLFEQWAALHAGVDTVCTCGDVCPPWSEGL